VWPNQLSRRLVKRMPEGPSNNRLERTKPARALGASPLNRVFCGPKDA